MARGDFDYEVDMGKPEFPIGVLIAGIIWVIYGSVWLMSAVAAAFIKGMAQANGPGAGVGGPGAGGPGAGGSNELTLFLMFLFGIAFFFTGIQAIRGALTSVRIAGAGSLVFSLLFFCVAGVGMSDPVPKGKNQGDKDPKTEKTVRTITAAVAALVGAGLALSGALAIAGSESYTRWRESRNGSGSEIRRRQPRDYDDDDRPRQARRPLEDKGDRLRFRRRPPKDEDEYE